MFHVVYRYTYTYMHVVYIHKYNTDYCIVCKHAGGKHEEYFLTGNYTLHYSVFCGTSTINMLMQDYVLQILF